MSRPIASLVELGQAGRMLDAQNLAALPEPRWPRSDLADRLRAALTVQQTGAVQAVEALSELLDVVLEEACALHSGWRKGPAVAADDGLRLLDGTTCKPRRILSYAEKPALAVFTAQVERLGLHKGRRPVAQAIEYLRRRGIALGLVTNGRQWRLLYVDTDNQAWLEWQADRWLDGDALTPVFELLRRVLGRQALEPVGDKGDGALVQAIHQTRRGKAELSRELGENVRKAVELLLKARQVELGRQWDPARGKDLYGAACHFAMRLVVVLFAEARELLPIDNPIYHHGYGLRGLQESLDRLSPERRRARQSAWPRLLALFRLLHGGSPHPQLLVPTYGGDLFRPGEAAGDPLQRALHLLESPADAPDDDVVYQVLLRLTRTRDRGAAVPVDFTELTSEYIGILYEGLLDYELHRVSGEPVVFLALGDQPALPLDRLEAMSDKQLAALVEKAKVQGGKGEEEEAEGEEEEGADEETEVPPVESSSDDPLVAEQLNADDERLAILQRALRWAERAAQVGKLVRAPRGKQGTQDPAWQRDLAAASTQLIADVKLPGELYLVRWGGTRKGAGTFYTRPQLTLPTVRRTLEPLLLGPDGRVRPPEELLALKVCDPAMGSGSFLVAALRVLTTAVVESLHVHGRLQPVGDHWRIDCALLPESDREQSEDHVEAMVRRVVVEHCLYGVDLDALAVELGRVALWVETLDRRLPFTFLDHKLRCGDALVGAWLDQFRDYPLLAWARQSPDEKWRGVTHEGDVWAGELKALKKQVVAEQAEVVRGAQRLQFGEVSDDALKAAIERVRELYRRLRAVPASQPDKRAEIWRRQVAVDRDFTRVKCAFDAWCALWFWPLDRLALAPRPGAWPVVGEEAAKVVREVAERKRFFHWELEFPDVFTEQGAGFDAVVGNPPWETRKPNSKEFFSDLDPLYRSYGKQDGLVRQRELFEQRPADELKWLRYVGEFKDAGNFVRGAGQPFGDAVDQDGKLEVPLARGDEGGRLARKWSAERKRKRGFADPEHPFRWQGSADLNSYKMFVEMGHSLLRRGGRSTMLVPSGVYSDKGSLALRELLLDRCDWSHLYVFQNERFVFADVHHSFKVAALTYTKGGTTAVLKTRFRIGPGDSPEADEVAEDVREDGRYLPLTVESIRELSPKTRSILEVRTERDLRALTKMYANSVLLGDDGPQGWGIKYATEFHMTNDSKLFIARDKAEAAGFVADVYGRWVDGSVRLLPVYQGVMTGMLSPNRAAWRSGTGAQAVWDKSIPPGSAFAPQFLVRDADALAARTNSLVARVLFRNIARTTDERTVIACVGAPFPSGHSLSTLTCDAARSSAWALGATLASFVLDWAFRERLVGTNLSWSFLEEAPLPGPAVTKRLADVSKALGAIHPIFACDWLDRTRPAARARAQMWALTNANRLRLRATLDAAVAALYGLDRDDLHWILRDCDHPVPLVTSKPFARTLDPKGFWRVDKTLPPELRHPVLTLIAFDDLLAHIAAHGGDRDAGLHAFLTQNHGEGWQLPETLRLADHGLGHDDRALAPQPVASALGPLYLDWQLSQTPEESWAECERHARAILGEAEFARRFGGPSANPVEAPPRPAPPPKPPAQVDLFGEAVQVDLFGVPIRARRP